MSESHSVSDNFLLDVEDYVKTEIDYLEVSGIQKSVIVLSGIYFNCILILFICISFLSLALGIACWIGEKVNNRILGFVFIAVLITTILSFFSICQSSFLRAIRNKLVYHIYK